MKIDFIKKDFNEEDDFKMIDIKTFEFNLDYKIFKLEIGKSKNKNNIILKVYENNNNFINKYFLLCLSIENFYNINGYFRRYQTIDDLYSLLYDILYNKKYSAISKENKIILILQFSIPEGKIMDINFELIEKKVKIDNTIEKLFLAVDILLKENKIIKEEYKNKSEELKNVKNELKYIKFENNYIKNRLKTIEENIKNNPVIERKDEGNKNYYDLNKSVILKNDEEKSKLKEWISINGKINKINFLYRATEDGDTSKIFFDKCGNKGPTISLIKTKKGRRFGGFSKIEWKDDYGNIRLKDNNAFLFSLDNMKKYNILKPEVAIGCYPNGDCLVYGNNGDAKGLFLSTTFLKFPSTENHSNRVYDVSSDFCLSGEYEFLVEEVEVYQIIFD